MSGTSMDGLDCGLFKIYLNSEYKLKWSCLDFKTYTYSDAIRQMIIDTISNSSTNFSIINEVLGEVYTSFSTKFLNSRNIDLISSHGQTISHIDRESTLQVGNPKKLNEKFQVPIVSNVRKADIEVGGNGAPLMPFLDWLFYKDTYSDVVTLNLGGMANLSFIPESGKRDNVLGFDTGPGMALIDECCKHYYNETMDRDGVYANMGSVNKEILHILMNHEYILKKPPKSTGWHEFGSELFNNIIGTHPHICPNDLIRTFCIFTAKSIAENLDKFINFSTYDNCLIISGGGVHHPVLIEDIHKYCKMKNIILSDKVGIQSDMKESLLMAVLGVARIRKIPANMPSVTGAKKNVILGDLIN